MDRGLQYLQQYLGLPCQGSAEAEKFYFLRFPSLSLRRVIQKPVPIFAIFGQLETMIPIDQAAAKLSLKFSPILDGNVLF